jgi:ribosome-binding factor A
VNELLREIIGDELERIDDPQLEWVSVTGVEVNPELTSARVFYSSLGGADTDPEVLAALGDRRVRLQAAIGRQARLRRTPELHFQPDSGVRDGWKVEALLREIGPLDPTADGDGEGEGADGPAGGDHLEPDDAEGGTPDGPPPGAAD